MRCRLDPSWENSRRKVSDAIGDEEMRRRTEEGYRGFGVVALALDFDGLGWYRHDGGVLSTVMWLEV